MGRYAARRLLGAIPLWLGVTTLVFFAAEAMPGDAVDLWLHPGMTQEVRDQVRRNLGLDRPAPVRFATWLGGLARGDLGYSVTRRRPVSEVLAELLPNTLLLSGLALLLGFGLGIALGVVQGVRAPGRLDSALSGLSLFLYSMPSFWLAIMAVLLFSWGASTWDWPFALPASGMIGSDHQALSAGGRLLDRIRHLVLPVGCLSAILAAGVARYTRAAMLEVRTREHVRAARARGLPERTVLLSHGLRNALPSVVTLLGLSIPLLIGGAIFVEEVFAWPGMGRLMFSAIAARDTHVIMACAVLFSAFVILGNLVADLLQGWIDPRVRR